MDMILPIYYLPPILWHENYMCFKSIYRMRRVFYFVFHFVKNLLVFFSDAVAKPSLLHHEVFIY